MTEWTGAKRKEFYQCLAEGRIAETRAILEAHKDLKKNDLKPVDKEAHAKMASALFRNIEPQRELAGMLTSESKLARYVASLCFESLNEFSGALLGKALRQFCSGLSKVLRQRSWDSFRRLGGGDESDFEKEYKKNPGLLNWYSAREEEIFNLFGDLICAFPSREGLEAMRQAPPYYQKHYAYRINMLSEMSDEKLAGEGKAGFIRREGLETAEEEPVVAIKNGKAGPTRKAREFKTNTETTAWEEDRIFDELKRYDPLFSLTGEELDRPPSDIQRYVKPLLEQLASQLDYEVMLKFDQFEPPVIAIFLKQSLAKILIRNYTFASVFQAARALGEKLKRDLAPFADAKAKAELDGKCWRMWVDVVQAMEKIDPVFKVSHPYFSYEQWNNKQKSRIKKPNQQTLKELERWDRRAYDGNADQMYLIGELLDEPVYAQVIGARLATCLESGTAEDIDWAFRLAFEKPERLISERSLLDLTSCGLWQVKAVDAVKAVRRLQALGAYGRCTPTEAAAAIEQAFTIEEPMLWRAAAEAIRDMRKKDPAIRLQNAGRVQELLERDEAKYGKLFRPILG